MWESENRILVVLKMPNEDLVTKGSSACVLSSRLIKQFLLSKNVMKHICDIQIKFEVQTL